MVAVPLIVAVIALVVWWIFLTRAPNVAAAAWVWYQIGVLWFVYVLAHTEWALPWK